MQLAFHGLNSLYTNVVVDIRVAREAGYAGVELWIPKLERYLDVGGSVADLRSKLGPLRVGQLDSISSIETDEPDARRKLLAHCERLCSVAQEMGCPAVQVIAVDALRDLSWVDVRARLARSLAELARVAAPFGIRLGFEAMAWAPIHTLGQMLEVLDAAGQDNIGLVVDTFHLWAGGTEWEQVAALDPRLIVCVHISDATPRKGPSWSDDDRAVLPGNGILPLKEAVAAIRETGYDGLWTVEMVSPWHWEWDPALLAGEVKRRAEILLAA